MVKEFMDMSKKWKIVIVSCPMLFVLLAVALFLGCSTATPPYVEAMQRHTAVMNSVLIDYILSDAKLDSFNKSVRIRAIIENMRLNAITAQANLDKKPAKIIGQIKKYEDIVSEMEE